MRFWKVIEPSKAKAARELFKEVLAGNENNLKTWEEAYPDKFTEFYEDTGGFNMCRRLCGIVSEDGRDDIPDGWRLSRWGIVPDKRLKKGKEASNYIRDRETQITYNRVYKCIGVTKKFYGRFTIPQIRESRDGTEVYVILDDKYELDNDPDVEEVTRSYVNNKLKEEPCANA